MNAQSVKNAMYHAKNGMIDLDPIATFVAVAREESFVAAARRTKVPPSTVSRVVARLESELGVRLFQRTSRRVALTEEGRRLLLETAPLVDGLAEAIAAVKDQRAEVEGVVRITAPAYTGATRIARAMAGLAKAHPGIVVELDATNAIRDLVADGFDLGIRVGPVTDADFVARRLWESELGLFASRAFLRTVRRPFTRELLATTPAVVLRRAASWRFVDVRGAIVEVRPNVRFAVNDPRAAVDVARQGLGLVVAPVEAAEGLVRVRSSLGEPAPLVLHLVYPSQRLLPRRVRVTIDWLLSQPEGRAESMR